MTVPALVRHDSRNTSTMMAEAEIVAQSELVPYNYQKKPANIYVAMLAGEPFGWNAFHSTQYINVIKGKPTLSPQAQLGLIRAAGHRVEILRGNGEVTVTGTRADNGDTMRETWNLHKAERAGLLRKDNWQHYPEDMCQWRAVSVVARGLFPDVIMALSYGPDEFGAETDETGALIEARSAPPQPAPPTPFMEAAAKELDAEVAEVVDKFENPELLLAFDKRQAMDLLLVEVGGDKGTARAIWDEHAPDDPKTLTRQEVGVLLDAAVKDNQMKEQSK